jgi:hypothetical protein
MPEVRQLYQMMTSMLAAGVAVLLLVVALYLMSR